jgi:tRNA G18 (ribose-2'-O)-methylase SpoU
VRHDVRVAHVVDLTDPEDSRLDDFRDLSSADRRPDVPGGKGLVIGEGALVVQRMLGTRFAPRAFLGVDRKLIELGAALDEVDAPFYRTTADVMAKVVGFHLNRGVLVSAARPEPLDPVMVIAGARTLVVLEGVNDHENLGSIFRNAAGLGVDGILFGPRCSDPLYRRSVRVSMGYVLQVPFAQLPSWPGGVAELKAAGFQVVALTPRAGAVPLSGALDAERVALLLGAEGPGLTAEALAAADTHARIPMTRGVDSLNVATAAALACYERSRLS